jgi:hypothetical protein
MKNLPMVFDLILWEWEFDRVIRVECGKVEEPFLDTLRFRTIKESELNMKFFSK